MEDEGIINWIKEEQNKGHDYDEIFSILTQQGLSPDDTRNMLNKAGVIKKFPDQPKNPISSAMNDSNDFSEDKPKKKINYKKILIASVIIILIGVLVFIFSTANFNLNISSNDSDSNSLASNNDNNLIDQTDTSDSQDTNNAPEDTTIPDSNQSLEEDTNDCSSATMEVKSCDGFNGLVYISLTNTSTDYVIDNHNFIISITDKSNNSLTIDSNELVNDLVLSPEQTYLFTVDIENNNLSGEAYDVSLQSEQCDNLSYTYSDCAVR